MTKKPWFRVSLWSLILLLAVSFVFSHLTPTQAQEPEDLTGDLVNDVVDPAEALRSQTTPPVSKISLADPDGDGLTTAEETILGTDPNNVDSDCDYKDDQTEVGNVASPTNTDGDSLIDALESVLADADGDTVNDEADSDTASPQVSCGQFLPFAIKLDNSETTRLEIRIAGGTNVTAVEVKVTDFLPAAVLKVDNQDIVQNDYIILYDDGSHGDRFANDGLWTRNGLSADLGGLIISSVTTVVSIDTLRVTNNGTAQDFEIKLANSSGNFTAHAFELGLVKADAVAQTTVNTQNNLQAASNLINIIDPLNSLVVKGRSHTTAAKRFYQDFGDDYDFVFFFVDSEISDGPVGEFSPAQNDVQNIGRSIFDNTAAYGSQGQLQGTMFLNFGSNGPTLHEVMHRWAAFGLSGLGFHQCASSHWGVVGVGEGQLGGFDGTTLVNNGNGTYTVDSFGSIANGGDSVNYVPLELYLAGLAEANEVSNITVPNNVDCNLDYSVSGKTTFSAAGLSTVTIGQIQNELGGARVPSFASAQKDFKTAMVIISQYPLNTSEMAFYNTWSKIFGDDLDSTSLKSFQEATNNVGTMDTKITIPLDESVSVDKMMVTTGLISASTELTYTLTISNSAGEALSNVTISDNIPAKTSYVPGSAVANPPIVDLAAFPTTTAGFSLANNSSVVVTYKLAVSAAAQNGDILTNTVTVSATNLTQVLTDQAAVTVGSQLTRLYLPLVIK